MKIQNLRLSLDQLTPLLLGGGLVAIYLATMAPGLTWANYGSDGGDLVTAAATGGVAHPTGYPVYLLMAQAFQLIPVGSLAYRTSLMSGLAAVSAAMLVYGSVTRFLSRTSKRSPRLTGLVAAVAFGLAPLVWSQAVITEVYAVQAFFIALIFFLCTGPVSPRRDGLCGLSLGLALGTHLTTVLLVPMILFANGIRKPRQGSSRFSWQDVRLDGVSLLRQLGFLLLASLIYLILPLRASQHPPVNWGDPLTPQRFWWLVSGQLYQTDLSLFAPSALWDRLQAWAVLFREQFGVIGLILGLSGLIVFFAPTRLHLITLWTVISFSAFAIIYDTSDSFVYLIPAVLSFSIWIGLGTDGLTEAISRTLPRWSGSIGWLVLLYLIGLSFYHWPQVDASADQRAERFGIEIMNTAPPQAILFADGDRAVFTLWYFHDALRERPDVVIVAGSLLPFDWYRESLEGIHPDLVLPNLTDKPWFNAIDNANPSRPVCYLYASDEANIECR
ncbi:MAG: DUF2723 domain-containing protein [Chloroflexi bacterium]|nr:DUF2723 domain-containing protein [Chloroflexota bacterium]